MEFEWDETKRRLNIARHGVDFVYAALIFERDVISRVDARRDYGEVREISLGVVDAECFVVVHTRREGRIRLISAWKGGRDERSAYEEGLARRHPPDEG